MVQLIAVDGRLYYPGDPKRDQCAVKPGDSVPLLCVYDQGDCDDISWPDPNRDNLHRALFDDRECGLIDDEEVLLPDGTSAWD
jgi:hypothetical protein